MKTTALLAALLLASSAASANEPPSVTIESGIDGKCAVTFTNPMLGIGWARMLFGEMTPDSYLALFTVYNKGNDEAIANAKTMIGYCLGGSGV